MRIEIVGSIGVGKTTLARHLSEVLGYPVASEIPEANPFWEIAYAGEGDVHFEKDVSFLLSHGVQIRQSSAARGLICDFSFYQDLAYARLGQTPDDLDAYLAVWRRTVAHCGQADVLIDLRSSPEVALDRIYGRGRPAEQALKAEFLTALRAQLDGVLAEVADDNSVLRIETGAQTASEVAIEALLLLKSKG